MVFKSGKKIADLFSGNDGYRFPVRHAGAELPASGPAGVREEGAEATRSGESAGRVYAPRHVGQITLRFAASRGATEVDTLAMFAASRLRPLDLKRHLFVRSACLR